MLSCQIKPRRKNADKIEGMASWLILGGVLPLTVALIKDPYLGHDLASFVTYEYLPYIWGIAMGVASLLVKRRTAQWQFIVALGAIGFLAAAKFAASHSSIDATVWPFIVLFIVYKQYCFDMKTTPIASVE